MNCKTFRKECIDLLDLPPAAARTAELEQHLAACPACAAHLAALRQTAQTLVPSSSSGTLNPPDMLKEKIMNRIMTLESATPVALPSPRRLSLWRPLLIAASLLLALGLAAQLWQRIPSGEPPRGSGAGAFSLVTQAAAAEAAHFTGNGTVHMVSRITVEPVQDTTLAGLRWLPFMLLEPDGKTNMARLGLPARPGETYTLTDDVWFDPAKGRFIRMLNKGKETIFATAFDGSRIWTYDPARKDALEQQNVTLGFKAPRNPAEMLGFGAGLPVSIQGIKEQNVTDAGDAKLADGTMVRVFRSAMAGANGNEQGAMLFKIRKDDATLAEMDWMVNQACLLKLERIKLDRQAVDAPNTWNLAGIQPVQPRRDKTTQPSIARDMIKSGVSVKQMAEKAAFESWLFKQNPAWAPERTIMDIMDPTAPGQRMFSIIYKAGDGRHVVLVESATYNRMMGMLVKQGKLVYTGKNGVKAWSGGPQRDAWLAGILLDSSRAVLKEKAATQRTGYILEMPKGVFPCLAINGVLSDEELHGLIDSLVPAREIRE